MKLISIVKSPRPGKKYRATFQHEGLVGTTTFVSDFGATGYIDATQGASPDRVSLYKQRHKKDLNTNNPSKPGYLSYYILWGGPNFEQNVRAYKKRFNL